MKHYKTPTNEIMAIDKGQEFLVQDDWVEISDEEVGFINGEYISLPKTHEQIEAQRKSAILAQIAAIETKQPRALREVALGIDGAVDRLRAIDDEISALRAQL